MPLTIPPAIKKSTVIFILLAFFNRPMFAQANTESYLGAIKQELIKAWPGNRTINLVFHGHSVPAGYFKTPVVKTFDAYPSLLVKRLKAIYPNAVINVIITAIGGENSVKGQRRFKRDVLRYRPDVLFIDYALNDRFIVKNDSIASLRESKKAMEKMIRAAQKKNIKIILLTPSPDKRENILQPDCALQRFTTQITQLAIKYDIGLADAFSRFKDRVAGGEDIEKYMSQVNHPNKEGHQIIADEISKWFGNLPVLNSTGERLVK